MLSLQAHSNLWTAYPGTCSEVHSLKPAHLYECFDVLVAVVGKGLLGGGVHLSDAVPPHHQHHPHLGLAPVVLGCLKGLQEDS